MTIRALTPCALFMTIGARALLALVLRDLTTTFLSEISHNSLNKVGQDFYFAPSSKAFSEKNPLDQREYLSN